MKSRFMFAAELRSAWRCVYSIIFGMFIFVQSSTADTECWVGEVFFAGGTYTTIGPYPDRASILDAAQLMVEEEVLGAPYQCTTMPPSPITGVELWCPWRTCILNLGLHGGVYETDNCGGDICIPWIADFNFLLLLQDGTQCAGYNYRIHALNAARAAIPPALCAASYTVRLAPTSGAAESETILTSIEPDKSTNIVAKVYDQNNQIVPNVGVKLALEAKENSGGHQHGNDTLPARTGTLAGQQVLTGNTGPSGQGFSFTYDAPDVSGDIDILATCTGGKNCTSQGPKQVWVGHKGLQPVGDNAVYRLIPNATKDPGHPDNHYLTLTAASRLAVFATLYHAKYPDLALLHLNDASLERGGIFDLNHNWRSPHWEHCRGAVIDIRANGAEGALDITSQTDPMIKKFQGLTSMTGASALWDVPKDENKKRRWDRRHFHVHLMGQEGLQCP